MTLISQIASIFAWKEGQPTNFCLHKSMRHSFTGKLLAVIAVPSDLGIYSNSRTLSEIGLIDYSSRLRLRDRGQE
jgi:hypothetical protein